MYQVQLLQTKDLLIADKKDGSNNDETSGVTLEFNHVLSQIQVKVKNTNPNLKYIIRGIRISNVIASGDYVYTPANRTHMFEYYR